MTTPGEAVVFGGMAMLAGLLLLSCCLPLAMEPLVGRWRARTYGLGALVGLGLFTLGLKLMGGA